MNSDVKESIVSLSDACSPTDEHELLQSLGCNSIGQDILAKELNDKMDEKLLEASKRKTKSLSHSSKKKPRYSSSKSKTSDVDIEESSNESDSANSLLSELTDFTDCDTVSESPLESLESRIPKSVSSESDVSSYNSPSNQSESPCSIGSIDVLDSPIRKPNRRLMRRRDSSSEYEETVPSSSDESSWDKSNEASDKKKESRQIDDSDAIHYQKRLNSWINVRRRHRDTKIKICEEEAPHPLYPDKDLNGTLVPGEIVKDLMEYQITGVAWFLKLFSWKHGGVLADEMGLGKTIQSIAFLASLYYSGKLHKPSIIICPATLTQQWVEEFHSWWPPLRIINLHSSASKSGSKKKASKMKSYVESFFNKKGIIFLASYEGVVSYGTDFAHMNWGCVILDEGHKISNPDTKTCKSIKQFKTPFRYILSGTPIQNKLKELWSIYDFVRPGLLGSQEEFDKRIARTIELVGSKGSDNCDKQLAFACARNLRAVIKPHILRRNKLEVANDLPKKTEQVVYCQLQPKQRQAYIDYLNSDQCQMILKNKLNHMVGISTLRKISNHPDLIYFKTRHKLENYGYYKASGKTRVLDGLMNLWRSQGHRVLIFCQTIQTMEIIQQMSFFKENKVICMNGSTPVGKRMAMVDSFNTDVSIFAFLLTTRTGGQGLNLTGANRVVIFDPDWNPTADLQALSRAWRLGQSKEVSIYRLLTAGTIEERVHHLQLYKQLLSDRILKDPQQKLLFRNHSNDLFAPPPDLAPPKRRPDFSQDDKKSVREAKIALLNSTEQCSNNAKDEERTSSENQDILNALGFGRISATKLDQEQQDLEKLPSTASWDKVAARKMGLEPIINTSFNLRNLPNLPASAFHTKGKKKTIHLPAPPVVPKVKSLPLTISASNPPASYPHTQAYTAAPEKRQPTLNRLRAEKISRLSQFK